MKEFILTVLKNNLGRFVSGEELSRDLQVSRTAVWKYIKILKQDGYAIESLPKKGYRLMAVPDLLTELEIAYNLQTRTMGRVVHYLPLVDSTNALAREYAEANAPEGTLVVAERQAVGRGRMGRLWESPAGGIWLSLILRPQIPTFQVSLITLLAAVAAATAIESVYGLRPEIKWPNDLLINGKKLVGILTEVAAEVDRVHYLIVGIGVNVNIRLADFPVELQSTATSILAETGRFFDRASWVRRFLELFEGYYDHVAIHGFEAVLEKWRTYASTLGQWVTVSMAGRHITGKAVHIDDQGALHVETSSGLVRCLAGEVTLCRPEE